MTKEHQHQNSSRWKLLMSFLSGGTAGIVSKTLIAPIERTRSKVFTYNNFFKDFMYIVKNNGIRDLWRGNSMNVLKVFPHAAIDFAVFDYLRTKFYKADGSAQQKVRLFLCGAVAGICSITITTPIEFVRVRLAMQIQNFSYKSNVAAFSSVHNKQGFLGFYRGFGAAICGIVIYHGCSFFIFTRIKQQIRSKYPEICTKWYVDFTVGAISSLGQLISYPLQILKRRMQGQNLLYQKKQIPQLLNYRQLIKSIIQKQGYLKGFYKGISLNFIKAPLSLATVWTVKNQLNRVLDKTYDL